MRVNYLVLVRMKTANLFRYKGDADLMIELTETTKHVTARAK